MKVKNANLRWYVLVHDFNSDTIINYNIFYDKFIEDLHKEYIKKNITNLASLQEYIDNWAKHHYWSKTEYEIFIGGLFTDVKNVEKIDVYRQIKMNLPVITKYVNDKLQMKLEKRG